MHQPGLARVGSSSPLLWGCLTSPVGLEADPLLLTLLDAGCILPVKQNHSYALTPWPREGRGGQFRGGKKALGCCCRWGINMPPVPGRFPGASWSNERDI